MSDDLFEGEDEGAVADEGVGAARRVGFLPAVFIQILKWSALGIGAILFIATVSFFTVKILGGGEQGMSRQRVSVDYAGKAPKYDWFSALGEIRGRSADETPSTILVDVRVGYPKGDKAIQMELIERTPQIRDIIRQFFTSKRAEQLKPAYENDLKAELTEKINSIMTDGKIKAVVFDSFNVVEF